MQNHPHSPTTIDLESIVLTLRPFFFSNNTNPWIDKLVSKVSLLHLSHIFLNFRVHESA